MNMKNKGFTLIELLIVVAILGVIGTIVSISLVGTLQNANQKRCDEFVKEMEDGACVYAGLSTNKGVCNRNNCEPIKLSELINQGLINEQIDACTGKNMNLDETVTVTWDNEGEKKCEYNGVNKYER